MRGEVIKYEGQYPITVIQAVKVGNDTSDTLYDYLDFTYARVTDLPVIDNELSLTSKNPVQNKVITKKLNDIPGAMVDSELSLTSKNAVENRVITAKLASISGLTVDPELDLTSKNPVENRAVAEKLEEVFQSVSNGKSQIAAAITDKGVETKADDTFATMANNIKQIETKGSTINNFMINYDNVNHITTLYLENKNLYHLDSNIYAFTDSYFVNLVAQGPIYSTDAEWIEGDEYVHINCDEGSTNLTNLYKAFSFCYIKIPPNLLKYSVDMRRAFTGCHLSGDITIGRPRSNPMDYDPVTLRFEEMFSYCSYHNCKIALLNLSDYYCKYSEMFVDNGAEVLEDVLIFVGDNKGYRDTYSSHTMTHALNSLVYSTGTTTIHTENITGSLEINGVTYAYNRHCYLTSTRDSQISHFKFYYYDDKA